MFTPQSALYGMRGMYGDGAPYRNRSAEQLRGYTGGNPNLPMHNRAAMPQFASGSGLYDRPNPGAAMGTGVNASVGQLMGMQQGPVMPQMPASAPGAQVASMPAQQMPIPTGRPQVPGYGQMGAQGSLPSKPMMIRNGQQRRTVMPIMGPRNAY